MCRRVDRIRWRAQRLNQAPIESVDSSARTEQRYPICLRLSSGFKPGLFSDDRRARPVRADSDLTSLRFTSKKGERVAEDGPRKRRVEIEDCAGGQIRCAHILVNERDSIQIQLLRALPRPVDVRRFQLDTRAA